MIFYVYALKSRQKDWIYVGMTNSLEKRIHQHNSGYNKSTKAYLPFYLIYTEKFETSIDARKREKYFKSATGKRKLRVIISGRKPV